MTSTGLNRFCRALVLLAALLEFCTAARADNLSSIFTNIAPAARAAIPRRASIIFIQCDGLGYGDLSCYGQTKFQTPNLDQLAAEGMRFTNYSAAADSPSSQAALMTGDFFSGTNVMLDPDEITVAQVLKNAGYYTGLIGEWNLGGENSASAPWRKGFNEFAGYLNPPDAENFYADYIFRYAPQHGHHNPTNSLAPEFVGHEMLYYNTGGRHETYLPDLYTKAALNFVKINQPDAANHYRPFFLLLNYKIPAHKITVPSDAPFSEETWPQPEKNKAALISRIDGYVGQLHDQLQKIGMTNNIAIFFSSAAAPKKTVELDPDFFHSNLATNDFRVPMIARWPENIPAAQVSGFKWSPQDFLPTAAEIGYAESPTNLAGISVLPVLLGRTQK
jgi:arylsulfatase A-like enzyme